MLKVFEDNKYIVTKRADADTARFSPSLVKLTTSNVLVIGGRIPGTTTYLSTVSCYNITSDTWKGDYPQLI